MTEIESLLEHIRLLTVQHAPADMLKDAMPFAILCLLAGGLLCVFGAKTARFATTCGFSILGAVVGGYVAKETGFPAPVCGLAGALMIGVIGYQTFRMWVGFGSAAVLSIAALTAFGYQHVLPHVSEFQQQDVPAATASTTGSFGVPSAEEQAAYRDRTTRQWASEFWAYVVAKDAQIGQNGRALAIMAMVTGLCLGVLAVRSALILSTSLVGTALVTTAAASVFADSVPEMTQAVRAHPGFAGGLIGGLLVGSLIVQTLITRSAPRGKSGSPKS